MSPSPSSLPAGSLPAGAGAGLVLVPAGSLPAGAGSFAAGSSVPAFATIASYWASSSAVSLLLSIFISVSTPFFDLFAGSLPAGFGLFAGGVPSGSVLSALSKPKALPMASSTRFMTFASAAVASITGGSAAGAGSVPGSAGLLLKRRTSAFLLSPASTNATFVISRFSSFCIASLPPFCEIYKQRARSGLAPRSID